MQVRATYDFDSHSDRELQFKKVSHYVHHTLGTRLKERLQVHRIIKYALRHRYFSLRSIGPRHLRIYPLHVRGIKDTNVSLR